jgi:arsenate reductase (glutaredoxin)
MAAKKGTEKKSGEIKIYHNPRCSKSRQALALLKEKNIEPEIVEYLKQNPTKAELKDLLMKLHIKAEDLVRKGEAYYKEKLKGKKFSEEEWVQIILEHPELIERPIVIRGNRALICRPPELVNDLL